MSPTLKEVSSADDTLEIVQRSRGHPLQQQPPCDCLLTFESHINITRTLKRSARSLSYVIEVVDVGLMSLTHILHASHKEQHDQLYLQAAAASAQKHIKVATNC